MTIKSVLSATALLAGIAFSGSAFAQTMVGTLDVSDENLPFVQTQCDALALEALENVEPTVESTEPEADPSEAEATEEQAANEAPADLDLSMITLEDCKAAGLVAE